VPAYNEADRLPGTLAALHARGEITHIIVADDGSTDATSDIARANGADQGDYPAQEPRQRRGAHCAAQAVPDAAEIILLLDADLGGIRHRVRQANSPPYRPRSRYDDWSAAARPCARRDGPNTAEAPALS